MTQPVIEIIVPDQPIIDVETAEQYTNTYIGPTNPNFVDEGIWIQTGLGPSGNDYTIWFEDGQ